MRAAQHPGFALPARRRDLVAAGLLLNLVGACLAAALFLGVH